MSQQPLTAKQLGKALSMDFRASDLGDTADQFDARIKYLTEQAAARENVTDAQREAGARYALVGAQIRQLIRQADELKGASGSSVKQNLDAKISALRAEQKTLEGQSGLAASLRTARQGSVSLEVQSAF